MGLLPAKTREAFKGAIDKIDAKKVKVVVVRTFSDFFVLHKDLKYRKGEGIRCVPKKWVGA